MGDVALVTGMIIAATPVGEYDRRIVLLTKERGKIAAFVRGARKQNSQFTGSTRTFVFGKFQMYEGKNSYTVKQVEIYNYFENIINDLDAVYLACYFAELAEYYGKENLDASAMINLLYATFKALESKKISSKLIKCIYEIKLIEINGEMLDFFTCSKCKNDCNIVTAISFYDGNVYCEKCANQMNGLYRLKQSTVYAIQYIITSPIEKLYTFVLKEDILNQLVKVSEYLKKRAIDKEIKSELMLYNI